MAGAAARAVPAAGWPSNRGEPPASSLPGRTARWFLSASPFPLF